MNGSNKGTNHSQYVCPYTHVLDISETADSSRREIIDICRGEQRNTENIVEAMVQ